jgi:hypothetical protein
MRAENVWYEKRPHERKFESKYIVHKMYRGKENLKTYTAQRIFKRRRTDRMEGKRDTSKIYVYI